MNFKLFAVGFVLGAALIWAYKPAGSKTSTEQQVRTEYRIITEEKIVEKPGGIREVVRTITDNSVKTDKSRSATSTVLRRDWLLSVGYGGRPSDWRPEYALQVQRRVLGPIFAGAYGRTDGEIGLLLSLEF